jgi:hypothetical protein
LEYTFLRAPLASGRLTRAMLQAMQACGAKLTVEQMMAWGA